MNKAIPQHLGARILLLASAFFLHPVLHAQSPGPYYKGFNDDNYEIYVVKDEMLGSRVGLKNSNTGRVIVTPMYDDIASMNEKYVVVCKNEKWGIVDTLGKVVIPINYSRLSNISYGRLFIANSTGKLALYNLSLQPLTKHIFDGYSMSRFVDGLWGVYKDDLWGFINRQGVVIIPLKYSDASDPMAGKIRVSMKSYETIQLNGTIEDVGKPWTQTDNLTYAKNTNLILDYSGKPLLRTQDNVDLLGNGMVLLSQEYGQCDLKEGFKNIQLYDKNLKKIIDYKACWSALLTDHLLVIENGTTHKCAIAAWDGVDFTKTIYHHFAGRFAGNDGVSFYKIYRDPETFFFVDEFGECAEVNGSTCE